MSFIFKQMLNSINTDIDALNLEDINIGIGGAALDQAIGDEVARAGAAEALISQRITLEIETVSTTSLTTTMQAEIDALKNPINNIFSMIQQIKIFQMLAYLLYIHHLIQQ